MTQDADVNPWPKWVRYSIVVVLGVAMGIGVITLLYDRGILPVAGIFVAMLVVPAIVFFRRLFFAGRVQRDLDSARKQLLQLGEAIEAERSLPMQARSTRASDDSLTRARVLVGETRDRLAADLGAALRGVERITAEATQEWSPESPLTAQVERVTETVRQLHERALGIQQVR